MQSQQFSNRDHLILWSLESRTQRDGRIGEAGVSVAGGHAQLRGLIWPLAEHLEDI